MHALIQDTAALIADFDPALARAFAAQPANRVTLAHAFASGLVADPGDDPHPVGATVLRVAYLDREARQ